MRIDSSNTVVGSTAQPSRVASASTESPKAGGIATSRSAAIGLALTTKDGDTVTIASSRTDTIVAGMATEGDTANAALLRSSSSTFSISVEGHLDHAELVDLSKALKALSHAARKQDAQWLERRLSRPDLDTVASVAASSTQSVAVIAGVMTLVGSAAPPDGESAPAA